jgi:Protein of unknown function DUF262
MEPNAMPRANPRTGLSEDADEFQLDLAEGVEDDSERGSPDHIRFNITFYGADYPVETIVQRMLRNDFFIPDFQRSYVWSQKQASRFIESLLYGLPVPGIFLYREPDSGRHLIIDGQQRLKTLQYFSSGTFGERRFRLLDISLPWRGRTYDELSEADKRRLNDAVIHATLFKQEEPKGDDQSIYHVFERINTGGTRLSGQEIRTCIYHGSFVGLLRDLNQDEIWREVYGPDKPTNEGPGTHSSVLSFYYRREEYSRPMAKFLNTSMETWRRIKANDAQRFSSLFVETIATAHAFLGRKAFRPERALNAAVFDSVMVGLATRLAKGPVASGSGLAAAYRTLLTEKRYTSAYLRATADEESVKTRMSCAIEAFSEVE